MQATNSPARSTTRKHDYGGTERVRPPEETLSLLLPHLRSFGITRLANLTGLDRLGLFTTQAVRPNARSLSVSQGKGVTLAAAKVSALMEGIEHHQAEHHLFPILRSSARDLARMGYPLADHARLPRWVRPLGASDITLWTPGTRLRNDGTLALKEQYWLPFECAHLDFRLPHPEGSGHFLATSSGLASGNTRAEAVLHAVCELVERDATTLFYRSAAAEQAARNVNQQPAPCGLCHTWIQTLQARGIAVRLWNITSDLKVPAYLCELTDLVALSPTSVPLARGMGCHPRANVAMLRALAEAAQSRLTLIAGSRDDIQPEELTQAQRSSLSAIASPPIPPPPVSPRGEPRASQLPTCEEDLSVILNSLSAAGMHEVLVIDLSPREPDIAVVRVVIPGLEASSEIPGYVPGERALALGAEAADRPDRSQGGVQ